LKLILLYLNRFAKLLKPIRIGLIVFTFFALLLTAYSLLVRSAFTLNMLEPSIVVSLWGMLLLANTELFQQLPDPVLPKDSFLQRMLSRCKLFFFYLLALIVLFVSLLLAWLSLRLLLI
jgi:hypothetical protein